MKGITLVFIFGLIAVAIVLPVAAAGHSGDGKTLQNGAGPTLNPGICQNPECPQEDCPTNQTPPQDGTGFQYGKDMNERMR